MGKGGKAQTIGYKYYLGMHLGLCHGPIDAITRLQVDGRNAWLGSNTGGQINVDAADLFGGEKREGGVSGVIDVAMGGPAQGKNSYLQSKLGDLIPAYRGIVGLIFRQAYLGNNPYLKPWSARGQRVHVRQNGIAQWYDAKAEINSGGVVNRNDVWDYQITSIVTSAPGAVPSSGWANSGPSPFGSGGGFSAPYAIRTAWPDTTGLWLRKQINVPPDGVMMLHGHVENAAYIYINGILVHSINAGNVDVSDLQEFFVSLSGVTPGPAELAVYATDDTVVHQNTYFYIEDIIQRDLNPAHIIRECLTDPDWGMGYTDDDIDDVSFKAAADQFYNEGLGLSLLWDKQTEIEEFVQTVQRHVDVALYVSRTTGKYVLKPIRGGYDESTLIHLDESNIISVDDPARIVFGELTNSVTVTYWDAVTGKDASVTVTDTAMVQQQGVVINAPLQYPGFTNPRNATIAAQRDLRALSSPLLSCTITADSTAKPLNVGDVFKFSWAKWGLVEVVMRISGIAYGTGRNNRVKITCTQDVFDTDTNVSIVVPTSPGWSDPSGPPAAITEELATEAPYYELVQVIGQSTIDAKLAASPEIGYVVAAGARPASAINANLYTDSGAGYEDVGALDFAPVGKLSAAIDKHDSSFTLVNFADLEEVIIGTHVQCGNELMRVDAIDTETGEIEVGRGVLDTVPEDHEEGDFLLFWDQYAGFDPTEYVNGEEVNAKITPVSGAGVLSLAEAPAMPVDIVGRPARPYAPGDLQVNAESYASGAHYYGELTLTWKHRDRLQQTSGVLVDHYEGSIGPEAGTLYRLQGYANGALIYTEDDIDGETTAWTPVYEGVTIRVEVHAKRDGLYSYQAPYHTFEYGGTPEDFFDDFNRPNENLEANTNWTRVDGVAGALAVNSNALQFVSTTDTAYQAPNFGSVDHFVEAIIVPANSSGSQGEWFLGCRVQDKDNYIGIRKTFGTTNDGVAVYRRVAGNFGTQKIQVNNNTFAVANTKVRLEVIGNDARALVDGMIVGETDEGLAGYTSSTRAGIIARNSAVNPGIDDFKHGIISEFTDPDPRNVTLISFNGVNAATAATDEGKYARAITFFGNAKLDNAQKTLGYGTSLLLDGSGDYCRVAQHFDQETKNEDYCVELWVYPTALPSGSSYDVPIAKRSSSSVGWMLMVNNANIRWLAWPTANQADLTAAGAMTLNTWNHIAITREKSGTGPTFIGTIRIFLNGVMIGSTVTTGEGSQGNTDLYIGRDPTDSSRDFNGRIQEVRITKGDAVYTANFTPPSTPFPR